MMGFFYSRRFWALILCLIGAIAVPLPVCSQMAQSLFLIPPILTKEIGQAEARLLEDKLVSGLLETGAFNVTADLSVRVEEGDSMDAALERARQSGMAFVLFIGLSADGRTGPSRSYTMSLRLIAVDTNKETYARNAKFVQAKADASLIDEAKRIAIAAKARNDVTPEMIDALIKAKDWEAAGRYLEILVLAKPGLASDLVERESLIHEGLAKLRYGQARDAASLRLYEEARRAIAEALALSPESVEYRSYARVIDEEYAAYLQQGDDASLRDIEAFLARGRIDVAAALVERASEGARSSPKGKILIATIQRKQEARMAALQAQALFADERYPEALRFIDDALRLNSEEASYIRLRTRIIDAERRRAATNERWSAYKEELEAFDIPSLFLARRSPLHGLTLGFSFLWIERLDPSQGSWLGTEMGPYPGLNLAYSWPLPWSTVGPLSFTQLASYAWAEGGVGWGVTREASIFSDARLVAETNTMGWLAGGLEGRAEVLSIALFTRVGIDASLLHSSAEHRGPEGLVSYADSATCISGSIAASLGLAWAPGSHWSLAILWQSAWPFVSGMPLDDGAPTRSAIGCALSFGGF